MESGARHETTARSERHPHATAGAQKAVQQPSSWPCMHKGKPVHGASTAHRTAWLALKADRRCPTTR